MKKSIGFLAVLTIVGAGLSIPASAQAYDPIVHIVGNVDPEFVPSESYYSNGSLWGLNSRYGINEPEALKLTQGSKDVVVGIIDTGITDHSDLNANVVAGYDFISNTSYAGDGNGRDSNPADPGDYYSYRDSKTNRIVTVNSSWHGTHVAGIVGALANGAGVVGVAPNVSIMPLRALGKGGGFLSDIEDAITWASGGKVTGIDAVPVKRADVLNLSLGFTGPAGTTCPSSTQKVIDAAVNRGTVVVVAAGNDGLDIANSVPANCNNVITVMATAADGTQPYWSNYGSIPTATGTTYVHAPGLSIKSTWNTGTQGPVSETYENKSGTSMATPFVAGSVALIRAANPSATVRQIHGWLADSANTTQGAAGVKIINAGLLVNAAMGTVVAPEIISTSPETTAVNSEITQNPAPVIEPAPVIDPIVAPAPITFAAKKKYSAKNFAAQSGVDVPKKSTVSLKVSSGKKFCKIKSGKLQTLKAGACTVSVKVATKVKVGKKYKTKTKTTKVALVVQ